MKNLKQVKTINGIKNIIMAENEKSIKNEDYLPSTELVLLSNEDIDFQLTQTSREQKEPSMSNPKLSGNSGNEMSRYNYLMENVINMEKKIYDYLMLISLGLGYRVNEIIRYNQNTKKIIKALSSELSDKCRYYISNGQLSFEFKGDDSILESNESGILVTLGAFACLRINLKYLELKNPELKGMSELLYFLYPEAVEAYEKVSKKFGFNNTVFIGFRYDSPEELLKHLKKMKVESWNNSNIKTSFEKKNQRLDLRLDTSMIQKLKDIRAETGISVSELIREGIRRLQQEVSETT